MGNKRPNVVELCGNYTADEVVLVDIMDNLCQNVTDTEYIALSESLKIVEDNGYDKGYASGNKAGLSKGFILGITTTCVITACIIGGKIYLKKHNKKKGRLIKGEDYNNCTDNSSSNCES